MRSINNKSHLLEAMLEEKPCIHAVCISETWLNKDKLELLSINNYHIASFFCRETQEGGGVCILIKNSIEYCKREDITLLSVESNIELCAIELSNINLLLINLYWPNSSIGVEMFLERLENLLKMIMMKDKNKKIILGGDFNVNYFKECKLKRLLSNLLTTYNFQQIVKEPTRITTTSSTCLDLIFINFNNKELTVNVQELGFSDHRGVELSLPLKIGYLRNYTISKRIFNDTNTNKFKKEISTVRWDTIISKNTNVNENYNSFNEILKKALNKCIPIKSNH